MGRRPSGAYPAMRLHKQSGQARIRLNGTEYRLGQWGSPAAQGRYDELIVAWIASGRTSVEAVTGPSPAPGSRHDAKPRPSPAPAADLTVGELCLMSMEFIQTSRPDDWRESSAYSGALAASRALRPIASMPAREFGPRQFLEIRDNLARTPIVRTWKNGKQSAARPRSRRYTNDTKAFTWQPEERVVEVSIVDGVATLTTTDDPPEHTATIPVAVEKAPGRHGAARSAARPVRNRPPGRSEDAKRWATLNAFEDHCAPHLSAPEQLVWHYLFRWCRDATAKASTRGMASARGLDPKTVTRTLALLRDVGLVWQVRMSSHKGIASVYGMHLHPEQRREACEQATASRGARRIRKPR